MIGWTKYADFWWCDKLELGDVVRFKSGRLRTCVNALYAEGRLAFASFPILKCSWTRRGHTGLCRCDLLVRATGIVGHVDLKKFPTLRALARECALHAHERVDGAACCDVVGVVS